MPKLITIIKHFSIFSFIGLGFYVFLIGKILSLWLHPQADDIDMIYNIIVVLMFEFFLINTGLFISLADRSWFDWLFGLGFFGLFAAMFNSLVTGNFILIIYGTMVLNRILYKIHNREKIDKKREMNNVLLNFKIYLGLVFVVACGSYFIPHFGLTKEFLETVRYEVAVNYDRGIDWSFEFVDMPHIAMCFGIVYYFTLSFMEIKSAIRKIKAEQLIS